jgi:hypothetical protein
MSCLQLMSCGVSFRFCCLNSAGPVATCRAEGLELIPGMILPLRENGAALAALCQAVQVAATLLPTEGISR